MLGQVTGTHARPAEKPVLRVPEDSALTPVLNVPVTLSGQNSRKTRGRKMCRRGAGNTTRANPKRSSSSAMAWIPASSWLNHWLPAVVSPPPTRTARAPRLR